MGQGFRFWLRWSWRDFRRRWQVILAIGLLLGGGVGLAAGLGSMRDWRVDSNDASFGALNVHDLRVEVEQGAFVRTGELAGAASSIPDSSAITAASERLILPTQIAGRPKDGGQLLTPGELVGVETAKSGRQDGIEVTGPAVDTIAVEAGTGLDGARGGMPEGILEPLYAEANGLEPGSRIEVAGGNELRIAGLGNTPETFIVLGSGGQFSSEEDFGVLFTPLRTAQGLAGRPDSVNDLVLTLSPGTDPAEVATQLETELGRALPGLGVAVSGIDDIDAHRLLYDDAENDQQLFNIFAFLILAGATFGAFNLVSRTVEAQRREIGIGMAIGVSPVRLALRPMLMGLQIAVIGVALGVGVGLLVNEWLGGLLRDQLPLPILETDFRPGTFAARSAIGFVIPLLAAAWPVWRGIRVTPVEAIEVGFRSARGGGLAPLLGRLPLPGGTLAQIPARNVLRTPRRTMLTVLATGAVISVVISMSGLLDSFGATVDRNGAEELRTAPDRLLVNLDDYYGIDSAEVEAVSGLRQVGASDSFLRLPGGLGSPGAEPIDVAVETLPDGEPVWVPRVSAGSLPSGARDLLISESAADDLGVSIGDEVSLTHPRRTGPGRFATVESRFRVSGTHPDPFRFPAFVGESAAGEFGLTGRVNALDVVPAEGIQATEVERELSGLPGVASVESAAALNDSLEEGLDEFGAVIRVVTAIAVLLVLLIAFNATAINADERAREHATMFAYGLPVRTVVRLAVVESLIMGLLATILGIAVGLAILSWVVNSSLAEILPDLGVVVSLSAGSIALAAVAGAVAMGLAPLLTVRRLRGMDIPSTLRVLE